MTDVVTSPLTIARLVIPESLDAPDAGPFLDFIRIANAACRRDAGHADLDYEAHEALVSWHDQEDWGHSGFLAERDGVAVGVAKVSYQKEEDAQSIEFELWIDPDRWGEGAEEALLAAVEDEARALGRRTIQIFTFHRPDLGGRRLVPSTGWGSVPADDRQTVFQADHGFTLEQVERTSAFDLHGSYAGVERLLDESLAKAGDDYRPVTWTSPTPEDRREGLAYAMSRMSTDAPQGGLVVDEQKWDADRVRRRDERLQAQRYTVSLACVEHVPSGRIVAYNEIAIQSDRTAATLQWGTLVLKEHRGHGLGAIVKCANLLRWRELVPESPRITTFNAEENRHMLDINEALGFAPVSYAGAWKKVLD